MFPLFFLFRYLQQVNALFVSGRNYFKQSGI